MDLLVNRDAHLKNKQPTHTAEGQFLRVCFFVQVQVLCNRLGDTGSIMMIRPRARIPGTELGVTYLPLNLSAHQDKKGAMAICRIVILCSLL